MTTQPDSFVIPSGPPSACPKNAPRQPYRSPSLSLDYLEAELPQSRFWRASTWPLALPLSAWLLSLRHGSSVRCDGAKLPSGPAVYVAWHRYSPLLVALLPSRIESLVALGGPMPHARA